MLSIALLALSSLVPAPAATPQKAAPVQRAGANASGGKSLSDWRRGFASDDAAAGTFNGTPTAFGEPWLAVRRFPEPRIYDITFNGTGTGWQERFLVGVPRAPLSPAPLLVMWHAFGVTEQDCVRNTGIMKRALERGWYVVAPRGAHDVNFGIRYAQQNIAYVLAWLRGVLSIDTNRVYGVGFSMGSGGALSFAARHLDPAGVLFAALVNHTGTVSVANAHANESQAIVNILEDPMMFGGAPSQFAFDYSIASVVDIDASNTNVDPSTDLARNLAHVPVETWSATHDPLTYLLLQSDVVHSWLTGVGSSTSRVEVVSNQHSWRTLNEVDVLDFLEAQTLSVPTQGTHRLLADRDARYLHFSIQQNAAGSFTPFRWNLDAVLNRVILDGSTNLQRLVVHTQSLGLDPSQELRVVIGITDGGSDEIALDGYNQPPSLVQRAGVTSTDWSHDAATGTVTLFESDGANYPEWRLLP